MKKLYQEILSQNLSTQERNYHQSFKLRSEQNRNKYPECNEGCTGKTGRLHDRVDEHAGKVKLC